MKTKTLEFGRAKKHKEHLPMLVIQIQEVLFEKPNQWCLAYKRFCFFGIMIMWFDPLN